MSRIRSARTIAAGLLATTGLCSPAFAQLAPPAPIHQSVDKNGVNLFDGNLYVNGPVLSIGQAEPQGIQFHKISRNGGWTDNVNAGIDIEGSSVYVNFGGHTDIFTISGSSYINTQGNGASLQLVNGFYIYTASDGTYVYFDSSKPMDYADAGRVTSIIYPSGARLTFNYQSVEYCSSWKQGQGDYICLTHAWIYRPISAVNSYGYQLSFGYDSNYDYVYDPNDPEIQPDFYHWEQIIGVSATNLAVASGASTPGQSWGTVGSYFQVTDPMGRVTKYRMSGYQVVGITLPGSSSEDETINYTSGRVTSVVTPAGTTTYSSSDLSGVRTVTVTDPLNHVTTYKFDIASQTLTSVTDPNTHTTSATYDSYGRITQITKPEGNYTKWTYDARGNITEQRQVAKSGSALPDIVLDAGYDTTCTNVVTCNQPNWTKDALGNQTDYGYDQTSGSVLTITMPASVLGGVRPQTRYSYTSLQAYFKNSTGSIVASGQPIMMLTGISACATTSSCAGTPDETKATISYGPQSTGVGNNLLPVSVSQGDGPGTLTATTANTYDDVGNLIYVDGPLPGTADTTRTLYNADREQIGSIDADPDGAGSLQNRAIRNTIDSRGLVTKVELGTTNGQSDAAWAAFATAQQVDTIYDARRRVSTRQLSAGGTAYALTQTDYYADDSLRCTAVRMNTAVYGSLPSSACSLSTEGSFGPDRISQNKYDPAGQLAQVQVGVGTADAANERTLGYSQNGMLTSLTDGDNNKTSYVYDGFDRLSQTQYPNSTKGSGSSNPSDYEQLGYDANSNVTQARVRSGVTINLAYDNLNRVVSKTSAALPEVDYTYDLLDRGLTAKFTSGQGITDSYDALSRTISTSTNVGGSAHTLTYQYDLAGNRTQMNWWDGFYVNYDRLVTGEISKLRENGAVSGVGVLATYGYDNLRNRTSLTAGNGTLGSWSYDPVGRLASLKQDLAGTANDLTITNNYSPASQIVSQTRSNSAYAWTGSVNVNRGYTSNGLNQYSTAGPANFAYDTNGNLTSDGTNTFTYDAENKLTSTSGSASTTLSYDPLNRLDTYNPGSAERFIYDGNEAVAEVDSSGNVIGRFVRGDGADDLLVSYPDSGTSNRRWVHLDERNSVLALTDASGNVTATNRYDEYGVPQTTNSGLFQYTGQMWLSQAGLQYSKARIYSPTLGRFMQTDPIRYGDGPNLYAYVLNDPVNMLDPTGRDAAIIVTAPKPIIIIGSMSSALIQQIYNIMNSQLNNLLRNQNRDNNNGNGADGGNGSQNQNTCQAAKKEPGKIAFTGVTLAGGDVFGISGGVGKFFNLQTGTSGYYFSLGGGVAEGVYGGATGGVASSMSAFLGVSINVSGAVGNYSGTFSFNSSGSTSSLGTAAGAGASATASGTVIFQCKLGS